MADSLGHTKQLLGHRGSESFPLPLPHSYFKFVLFQACERNNSSHSNRCSKATNVTARGPKAELDLPFASPKDSWTLAAPVSQTG